MKSALTSLRLGGKKNWEAKNLQEVLVYCGKHLGIWTLPEGVNFGYKPSHIFVYRTKALNKNN